jgi:hypothetical protein
MTTCFITGVEMLDVPAFALPVLGARDQRHTVQPCTRPFELVEHCGGCGWHHEHEDYRHLGLFLTASDALTAANKRVGHVGVISESYATFYVCAGSCCRDARISTQYIAAQLGMKPHVSTIWAHAAVSDEEAEGEYWEQYEAKYAPSAALGL